MRRCVCVCVFACSVHTCISLCDVSCTYAVCALCVCMIVCMFSVTCNHTAKEAYFSSWGTFA